MIQEVLEDQVKFNKTFLFLIVKIFLKPREIIHGAADELLRVLKSDTIKEVDKKKTTNALLGAKLSDERFAVMINLSKKLTDFNPFDDDDRENVKYILFY